MSATRWFPAGSEGSPISKFDLSRWLRLLVMKRVVNDFSRRALPGSFADKLEQLACRETFRGNVIVGNGSSFLARWTLPPPGGMECEAIRFSNAEQNENWRIDESGRLKTVRQQERRQESTEITKFLAETSINARYKKKKERRKERKENAIPSLAARSVRLLIGPLGLFNFRENR